MNKEVEVLKMYTYPDIVIYGCADCGQISSRFLELLSITIRYFCDSKKENWGKLCCGKEVVSPKELAELGMDIPIFIASRHGMEIREQLLTAGFTNLINPHIHELWARAKPMTQEISTCIGCKINCRFCNYAYSHDIRPRFRRTSGQLNRVGAISVSFMKTSLCDQENLGCKENNHEENGESENH